MKVVNIEEFNVTGLKVRTNNQAETNTQTAKIATLWNKAVQDCFPNMLVNGSVYGVYHNYESDVTGDYDLLVGSDKIADSAQANFTSLEVKAGKYLKFEAEGEMPEVCINLWQNIWKYFQENQDYERSYTADFEKYTQAGLEIYIAIK